MAQVDIVAIPASSKYAIVEDLHLRRSYQHVVGRILRHWDARNMKTSSWALFYSSTRRYPLYTASSQQLARDSNLNVADDGRRGRRAMIDSGKEQRIWRSRRSNTVEAESIVPEHELRRLRSITLRMVGRTIVRSGGITQALNKASGVANSYSTLHGRAGTNEEMTPPAEASKLEGCR